MMRTPIALTLALLVLSACGTSFTGTYSGSYIGMFNGQSINTTLTMTMTQNGSAITGTYTTAENTEKGNLASGAVNGNKIDSMALNSTYYACQFTASGTLENSLLTGTVSGTSTGCVLNAAFTLTKQQ